MKRVGHLYEKLISTENLVEAIVNVNAGHRWYKGHRRNRTVAWVESDIPARTEELREILVKGFTPKPVKRRRRFDKSAGKWRDICEPVLWPDQYVHHALIQALEPVMMKGMDNFCCGSIKGRGIHYGMKAMKRWMKNDPKGTRWCLEMDIHHFYNSLKPEVVMDRLKRMVKDKKVLELAQSVMAEGVLIGLYPSQWFANTSLQPLDVMIRQNGAAHYLRYMDNFTVFSGSKRTLRKILKLSGEWLNAHGMELKGNWQIFRSSTRLPCGLGYRFGSGFTLLRKRNLLRIKRQLQKFYKKLVRGKRVLPLMACGIISRLAQLKHCNSTTIYRRIVRSGTVRELKKIVRENHIKGMIRWNLCSEEPATVRPCAL